MHKKISFFKASKQGWDSKWCVMGCNRKGWRISEDKDTIYDLPKKQALLCAHLLNEAIKIGKAEVFCELKNYMKSKKENDQTP